MVDIHCHILPGVDDGAADMEEAVKMARMAAASGVRTIVATPHCNLPWGADRNFLGATAQPLAALQRMLEAEGIPVRILHGAEVFCTPDFEDLLIKGRFCTLGDSRYLLMEFYFDETPEYMERCFCAAERQGYIPVIAHPERYEAAYREPELVPGWFHRGWVIQLNKGSILGRLGQRAETVSRFLLERGFAHVVASDAHSGEVRTTHMTQLRRCLEDACSPEYARILLSRNPERIITGRPMV